MSEVIDYNYVSLLSPQLEQFKQLKSNLFSFRCPICGDSKSNKYKKSAYFIPYQDSYYIKCHKCGYSNSLKFFLREFDQALYNQYLLEYLNIKEIEKPSKEKKVFMNNYNRCLERLQPVLNLPDNHQVNLYLKERKIPRHLHNLFYYTDTFKTFVNSVKKTFSNEENDHPRLIIPFFNESKELTAFQGRSLDGREPKYVTIKLNKDTENIYGLDRLDLNSKFYVVEGAIDSIFLKNCIAVNGSSFDIAFLQDKKDKCVLVIDNEPRNKEIVKLIKKYIDNNYNVCIMDKVQGAKDINELVKLGYSQSQIMEMIDCNVYNGIKAQLKFAEWKKL